MENVELVHMFEAPCYLEQSVLHKALGEIASFIVDNLGDTTPLHQFENGKYFFSVFKCFEALDNLLAVQKCEQVDFVYQGHPFRVTFVDCVLHGEASAV